MSSFLSKDWFAQKCRKSVAKVSRKCTYLSLKKTLSISYPSYRRVTVRRACGFGNSLSNERRVPSPFSHSGKRQRLCLLDHMEKLQPSDEVKHLSVFRSMLDILSYGYLSLMNLNHTCDQLC